MQLPISELSKEEKAMDKQAQALLNENTILGFGASPFIGRSLVTRLLSGPVAIALATAFVAYAPDLMSAKLYDQFENGPFGAVIGMLGGAFVLGACAATWYAVQEQLERKGART